MVMYITTGGFKALKDEFDYLKSVERPKVVNEVAEAAAQGYIRPEDVALYPAGTACENALPGEVLVTTFLGRRVQYNVRTAIGEFTVKTEQEPVYSIGSGVTLALSANKIIPIEPQTT